VLSPSVPTPWEYIVAYSIDQGGETIWRSNILSHRKLTATGMNVVRDIVRARQEEEADSRPQIDIIDSHFHLDLIIQWQLTSYGCSGTALLYYFQHVTVALMSTPS
jgi:hypothetical protein